MSFASTIFHQGAKSTTVLLFMASSKAKQVMAELKPSSMFVAGSAEDVFKNGYCSIIGNYKTCCHIRIYHFPLNNIKRAFCLIFADDIHSLYSYEWRVSHHFLMIEASAKLPHLAEKRPLWRHKAWHFFRKPSYSEASTEFLYYKVKTLDF